MPVCVCVCLQSRRGDRSSLDPTRNTWMEPGALGCDWGSQRRRAGAQLGPDPALCTAQELTESPTGLCLFGAEPYGAPGARLAAGRGYPSIPKAGSGSGGSSVSRSGAATEPPLSRPFPGKREPELVCSI